MCVEDRDQSMVSSSNSGHFISLRRGFTLDSELTDSAWLAGLQAPDLPNGVITGMRGCDPFFVVVVVLYIVHKIAHFMHLAAICIFLNFL